MKIKARITIELLEDGRIGIASTSNNHITNLGMLGVAQSMFQKAIEEPKSSPIVQPEVLL